MKELGKPPQRKTVDVELIGPILAILFVTSIIVLIICWVCPSCCLHKRFRSPRRKCRYMYTSKEPNAFRTLLQHCSTFDSSCSCDCDNYSRDDTIPSAAGRSGQSVPSLPAFAK